MTDHRFAYRPVSSRISRPPADVIPGCNGAPLTLRQPTSSHPLELARGGAVTRPEANAMPEHRSDVRGLSYPNAHSESELAAATLAALDAAVTLARHGDRQRARELCAAVVFKAQPIIAARQDLLRAVLHALLVAQAFTLLSRVVIAMGGGRIEVEVLPERARPSTPPCSRKGLRGTIYTVDPRWLAQLAPDDVFLRRWCNLLISERRSRPDAVATASSRSRLEPA